jgi:Tfp pilus assembly protein PilE
VELLAALLIVAVLARFAVPALHAQLLRTNRADARAALFALAAAEESYYLKCGTYTGHLDEAAPTSCSPSNLRFNPRVQGGRYRLDVLFADAATWQATATADAAQSRDKDCRILRLDNTGARTALTATGTPNDAECWRR